MARRKHHEEHANHEAWAIPYGDLLTLLLAFFVVMYAISSLNEGKYRVMADALTQAFGGPPRTINPVQVGNHQLQGSDWDRPSPIRSGAKSGPTAPSPAPDPTLLPSMASQMRVPVSLRDQDRLARAQRQLDAVADRIGVALAPLIEQKLISVRRAELWIEVEINSDILFATASASLDANARDILAKLSDVLRDAPNGVRVEGHTDNQPISTPQFPSNWELSAARAASVVHLLADNGVEPKRLAMVGYGEFRARADNATEAGRNANRRVTLVILADSADRAAGEPSPQSLARASAPAGAGVAAGGGGLASDVTEGAN